MKYLIRASWAVLIACFIIKIFGGNYFEIATNNENFIKICNFVDDNFYLKVIIECIMSLILTSFSVLAIMKRKFYTKTQALFFIPTIIASSIFSWYFTIVKLVLDVFILIIYPLIFKTSVKRIIIGNLLIIAFQLISLITKNVGSFYLNNESTLIALIINVDTLIMCILYYLYSNNIKKEVN